MRIKKKYPKISIVTPSFNQGKFIKETIDSILDQKYSNLEYWIIDGGSTDETVNILKSYGKKIKWISEKDKGQTNAINKGIKKTTGDIIMYLNSDDVMMPNTLNVVAQYFMQHPDAMWLTGDYFIIDENGKKIQSFIANYKKLLRKYPSFNVFSIANFIIQPSTFWKKEIHDEFGLFDEKLKYCMDYDFWMKIYKKYKLHVLKKHFSLFRIHSLSKGGSQYKKQFVEEHQVCKKYNKNPLILFLHKIHAFLIVSAYKIIK